MENKKETNPALPQYVLAVKEIKNAIIDSRYRAARQVNKEVLELNYGIGRFISENSRRAQWGSNAIAVISKMLQQELPGLKGYSEASIKMMRIFYEEWSVLFENRQLTIDDFNNLIDNTSNNKITICHFSTEKISESDLTCFLNVGFTNHYIILTKTKSLEERLFYIRRCAKEFWNVETTKYHLKEDLYHKEGSCLFQTHQNQWVFQHIVHHKNYQNASEKHCQVLMI